MLQISTGQRNQRRKLKALESRAGDQGVGIESWTFGHRSNCWQLLPQMSRDTSEWTRARGSPWTSWWVKIKSCFFLPWKYFYCFLPNVSYGDSRRFKTEIRTSTFQNIRSSFFLLGVKTSINVIMRKCKSLFVFKKELF